MFRYRRNFTKDFTLLLSIVLGWLLWWHHLNGFFFPQAQPSKEYSAFIFWSFACGVGAISVLYWIDHFKPFKIFKFLPEFLAIIVTLPIVGLLLKPFVGVIFDVPFIRAREIFWGAFYPALTGALTEALGVWILSKSSVKSTVYLALTQGETERFIETIKTGGWENYYRILTQEEFNGALATGGRVDYIVISRIATKNFIMHQNILQAQMLGVAILDYRTLLSQMRGHISVHDTDIWTFLAGSVKQNALLIFYRGLKFYLEPVAAALMILILSPLFLIVSLAIKLTSPGPVFFKQKRTGYLGVEFDLVKFRSMRTDAEAGGIKWATKNDNRVTRIGSLLRKTRLDEIPQLWNVLKGEMSFMGPRPERPEFYDIINKQVPHFKLRLLVRPGITGWAQLLGGYAASIEESERKLEYDLFYMQYMSPRMDLVILGRTILTLLRGDSGR